MPDRQKAEAFIAAQFEELVAMNKARYGKLFQTTWMYHDEVCPCCARRKAEVGETPGPFSLSLNTFLYNEQQVLIGYMLCRVCAMDLLETSKKRKTLMHERIEQCLIAAYERQRQEGGPARD